MQWKENFVSIVSIDIHRAWKGAYDDMSIIKFENVSKKYGKNDVLKKINFSIEEGTITGMVGPNGAGKTTIFKLIANFMNASQGAIYYKNVEIEKADRREIGFLVENPKLDYNLTAYDNLKLLTILTETKDDEYINKVLQVIGLDSAKGKKVKEFSLGMKQRLGIGMAIVTKPKLIILDEPLNGLDPEGIVSIRKSLIALNEEWGITILISSHMLTELNKLARNYIFIANGEIKEEMEASKIPGDIEEYYMEKIVK